MEVIDKLKNTINNWWIYLIIGFFFLLGSFYVFSVPAASYLSLSIFFAVFMFIDGIGGISISLTNREHMKGWGWQLTSGIISLLIGISLLIRPGLSMVMLPIFVGFWVLMKGSLVIGTSFDLKSHEVKNWGWILILGILNTMLGMAMIVNPIFGVSMVLILTGISLLSLGISMITISLWLRKIKIKVIQLKKQDNDKLEELKISVDYYIKNKPNDIQSALKHIKEKVDNALSKD